MTDQLTEEFTGTQLVADPGPPAPIRIAWAPVPKVNLLPMEIMETRRFRRTQILLGAAVLGALVLAGAAVVWAQQGVTDANDQLAVAEARVTSLQAEQNRYATVPQVIAQVAAANAARTQAMGTDVLWYRYLSDVRDAQPTNIKLGSLTLTLTAVAGGAATGTESNALSEPGIGTIQTGGTAAQYSEVSAWLEALNKINGTASSYLSNAAKSDDAEDPTKAVSFTAGAVITSDALSNRYNKEAG